MATTYHQIYIQTVFPVKFRKALIQPEWKSELQGVLGNLINEKGCKTIIVNGTEDHMHCLFGLHPTVSVSDLMKSAKSKSSKWLNETGYLDHRFEWQPGFGCFSYSRSHLQKVYGYIEKQEEKHRKISFKQEYMHMLRKYDPNPNKRYEFEDLI